MSQARRAPSRLSKLFARRRRGSHKPRSLMQAAERLELRQLMAGDFNPFHNYHFAQDVNNDFAVTPFDALLIINELNSSGPRALTAPAQSGGQGEQNQPQYLDVNGDGFLSPIDALQVINHVNAQGEHTGVTVVEFKTVLFGENGREITTNRTGAGTVEDPFVYTLSKDDRFGVSVQVRDARPAGPPGSAFDNASLGVYATYVDLDFDPTKTTFGFSEVQKFSLTNIDIGGSGDGQAQITITVDGLGTTAPILVTEPGATGNDAAFDRTTNANAIRSALNTLSGGGLNDVARVTVDQVTNEYSIRFLGDFVNRNINPVTVNSVPASGTITIGPVTSTFEPVSVDLNSKDNIDRALNFNPLYGPVSDPTGVRRFEVYDPTNGAIVRAGAIAAGDTSTIDGDGTDYQGGAFREFFRPYFVAADSTAVGVPTVIGINPPGIPDDGEFDASSQTLLLSNVSGFRPQVPRNNIHFGAPVHIIIRADVTANPDNPTTNPALAMLEGAGEVTIDVLANDTNNNNEPANKFLVGVGTDGNLGPVATSQGTVRIDGGVIKYTPNANAFGPDTFTYFIADSAGGQAQSSATVTLEIEEQNDPPVANDDTGVLVREDTPTVLNAILTNDTSGVDPLGAPNGDVLGFAPLNTTGWVLPANGTLTLVGGQLTYSPSLNFNGADTFTYVLSDGRGGTDTATVSLTVTAVNDVPSFTVNGGNPSRAEDSGAASISGFVAGSAGPANESGQTLSYSVSNNNTTLFSAQPTIAPDGTLTFTPALNQFGTATVTVSVSDNGGIADGGVNTSATQTFTINITAVNDAPTFTVSANHTSNEDAGPRTVANFATNIQLEPIGSPATTQTGTFEITNVTNAGLFLTAPQIAPNGTLTYTAAPNASGSSTVTVQLRDNGGTPGVDVSGTQTFTISVVEQNDPPTANDETLQVPDGVTSFLLDVLANDSIDPDVNETLTVTSFTTSNLPANVTVSLVSGELRINSPLGTFNVPNATVNYTISDGRGGTDTAVATLVFIPNRLPLAVDDSRGGVTEDQAGATTFDDLLNNDRSVNFTVSDLRITGLSLTDILPGDAGWQTTVTAADGTVITISDADGNGQGTQVSFDPGDNVFGSYTFYYRVDDVVNQADEDYDGADVARVIVTITGVNDPPTIALVGGNSTTVNEDAGAQTVSAIVTASPGPGETAGGFDSIASYQIVNSNTALFSMQPTINPATGNLTFTAAGNANGTAELTIRSRDSFGVDSASSVTYTINVTAVNDEPTFTRGADVTVPEDAGAVVVATWASNISRGPSDEAGQQLTFTVTSAPSSLFTVQPSVDPATGNLTFTTAPDAFGSVNIQLELSDNGGIDNGGDDRSSQVFTINITAVNDPPTFTVGANETVNEDAGLVTVSNFINVAASTTGAANETQALSYEVTGNTNASLFAVAPAISPSGTLTYTPAANANGAATISVRVRDDNGTPSNLADDAFSAPQNFTITVNAVNDAPTFTPGPATVTRLEDAGAVSTAWATNVSVGPANESSQTPTFAVTNNNNALFSVQPSLSATGQLTFTPAPNANGSAIVTVDLSDNGGVDFGGDNTANTVTFNIAITAVNDAPSFNPFANPTQVVAEDSGAQVVSGFATGMSAGPADESGQTLNFEVSSNNTALFSVQPAIDPITGNLTYTPAPNANTTTPATITVRLRDNGGIANGGVDVSGDRTFTISVTPVNDPPTANPDTFEVFKTVAVSPPLNVVQNDSSAPDGGETLTVTNATFVAVAGTGSPASTNLSVDISADGRSLILNNPDQFYGTVTVTYTIDDGSGAANSTATTTATINVLNFQPGFISGIVWADVDGDSVVDPGNPPMGAERRIAGVEVTLTGRTIFSTGPNDTYTLTTTTNALGEYTFNDPNLPNGGVVPGTYTIRISPVELMVDGQEVIGSANGATVTNSAANEFTVVFGQEGATITNMNFAVLGLQAKYINFRDHLASSTSNGVIFGANLGATGANHMYWSSLYDGWTGWTDLKITIAADLSVATVEGRSPGGQLFRRTLSFTNDFRLIRIMGRDGNNIVVRLVGTANGATDGIFRPGDAVSGDLTAGQGEDMSQYAAAADALYGDDAW